MKKYSKIGAHIFNSDIR